MMDSDFAKTAAAFGGLGLGLFNLGITVYKDFFRKAVPTVDLKSAVVRCVTEGTYDFQIDMDLNSKGGDVYLKVCTLEATNEFFDPANNENTKKILKFYDCPGEDLLRLSFPDFKERVDAEKAHNISNTKIQNGEHRRVTFMGRIVNARFTDGYWEWPLSGWNLCLDTSSGIQSISFDFVKHSSSQRTGFIS